MPGRVSGCSGVRRPRFRVRFRLASWLVLQFIASLASGLCNPQPKPAVASKAPPPFCRNGGPGVSYVGSRVCASCHVDIYNRFIATDMGRSVSLPDSAGQQAITSTPVTVKAKEYNRYFQVFRRGSNIYQSEYELGEGGKEIFRDTQKVNYVIGAGVNGFTYVVGRGNYLFEAPLSYYARSKTWELSPGYEFRDYGFSRPIRAACISCHSGLPRPDPHRNGLFKDPPFREMAVGCESCHGPGELHVKAMKATLAGIPIEGRNDPDIVNPANLPGWLADNICMKCHQIGDARVLQPDKHYADFRPGTPLNDVLAIFSVPFSRQQPPKSPFLQQYELMIMSKCYGASGGKLHCITCHDPHRQPSAAEAPVYYRQKCFLCHTDKSCALPLKVRLQKPSADNCIGCHMPKQNLKVISHSAITNHRIISYKGEPFPEAIYHQSSPRSPGLIQLDAVPGSNAAPPLLTLLQAYGHLLAQNPVFGPKYLALLRQLEGSEPENPIVRSAVAREELSTGTAKANEAARRDLARAIKLGSTEPSDYELWAKTLAQTGNLKGAITVLQQGVVFDPFYPRFYQDLARSYLASKQYSEALQTIRQELKIFPEDSFMRGIMNTFKASGPGFP